MNLRPKNEETRAHSPCLDSLVWTGGPEWQLLCATMREAGLWTAPKHQGGQAKRITSSKVRVLMTPWPSGPNIPRNPSYTFGLWKLHDINPLFWLNSLSWVFLLLLKQYVLTRIYSLSDLYLQHALSKERRWMFKMVLILLSTSKVFSQTLSCFKSTIAKQSSSHHYGSNLSAIHFSLSFRKQNTDYLQVLSAFLIWSNINDQIQSPVFMREFALANQFCLQISKLPPQMASD